MGHSLDSVQLVVLGCESTLASNPVVNLGNRPHEGRRQSILGVANGVQQAVARLPKPRCQIGLQLECVLGLGNGCGDAGLGVGFATAPTLGLYRPGWQHAPLFGIRGQHPLQQAYATDAINQGMMHLGVERKAVVLQAFNDVAFPQWPGKIQRVGMQAGHQNTQFTLTAGAGQRGMAYVVIQIDVFVDLPAGGDQPSQQTGSGQFVAPGRSNLTGFFHAGDQVTQKGFGSAFWQ